MFRLSVAVLSVLLLACTEVKSIENGNSKIVIPMVGLDGTQVINTPTPLPISTPTVEPTVYVLTVPEIIREVWPDELEDQALIVARKESGYRPDALGDNGNSLGVFQLNGDTWSRYCGIPREELMMARSNIECALEVYWYDVNQGQEPWKQWTAKPW